jgi:hypothetical protein
MFYLELLAFTFRSFKGNFKRLGLGLTGIVYTIGFLSLLYSFFSIQLQY